MKKNILVLILIIFSIYFINPEISENFESGGIAITGYFGFNINFSYDNMLKEISFYYTSMRLAPVLNFFVIDNLSFRFSNSFFYSQRMSYSYYNDGNDRDKIDEYFIGIGLLNFGIDYNFYFKKYNNKVVPYLSSNIGFYLTPGIGYKINNFFYKNKSLILGIEPSQRIGFYVFLNDRTAIFLNAFFSLNFDFTLVYFNGDIAKFPETHFFNFFTGAEIGFTYFVPRKDMLLIKTSNKKIN